MKRNPIVITTLLAMVIFSLAAGSLYVTARAGNTTPGAQPIALGPEEFDPYSDAQADTLYQPLVIYEWPPVPPGSTATPTRTTTPTPTNTPTQLPNEVVINYIESGDKNEEYVRVKNRTTETVDITGWTIKAKESGKKYTFPSFYLDPNDAVKVWTKVGSNTEENLYWGLTSEVWDDDDDCGRLGDNHDELLFWYCYSSGTPEASTPTSQPIPDVIINFIEPGDDNQDYSKEYVRVKNRTLNTVNLKDWTIKSVSTGLKYTFPDFKLRPDAAVKVWTQAYGTDDDDNLYWGAPKPVWDNKSDCARLGNDDDELVDWYCYPP